MRFKPPLKNLHAFSKLGFLTAFYLQADDHSLVFQHKIDLIDSFPPIKKPVTFGQCTI